MDIWHTKVNKQFWKKGLGRWKKDKNAGKTQRGGLQGALAIPLAWGEVDLDTPS